MTSQQKDFRAVRKEVKRKVASGELRKALEGSALTVPEIDSVVRHAGDCRHMRNLRVSKGPWLQRALQFANWSKDEIDFLVNRSYSRIYRGLTTDH
jgi:3-oxoacyl-[acyl-carrier-protein] synthase III